MYKCDNYYNVEADAGIVFDDREFGIDWQIDLSKVIILEKDDKHPTFSFVLMRDKIFSEKIFKVFLYF